MSQVALTPIELVDLEAVGRFLTTHMNAKITPQQWVQSVTHAWSSKRPNYGMKLVQDDRIVGVFLAIYSDQHLRGESVSVCNPHTWCVLPAFRSHAVGLASALVRQPGFHFSMLTPNPNVTAVFRFMKFKDLDNRVSIFPNLPWLGRGYAESDPQAIPALLSAQDRADFQNHASIPWLRHCVVGESPESYCWIVYKPRRWKRLPCAGIIHVSDALAFKRYLPALRNHLLVKQGFAWTRVETRFVGEHPPYSFKTVRTQPKLFLSNTLSDADVHDLYSELASLDL